MAVSVESVRDAILARKEVRHSTASVGLVCQRLPAENALGLPLQYILANEEALTVKRLLRMLEQELGLQEKALKNYMVRGQGP